MFTFYSGMRIFSMAVFVWKRWLQKGLRQLPSTLATSASECRVVEDKVK